MAAFESFSHFEQYWDEVFDVMDDFMNPAIISLKDLAALDNAGSESRLSTSINMNVSMSTDMTSVLPRKESLDETQHRLVHEPINILGE